MKINSLLLGIAFLAFTSCSKSGDSTLTAPVFSTFTFYGSIENDIVVIDTISRSMFYNGQSLTYARSNPSDPQYITIRTQTTWGINAQLMFPQNAPPSLQIESVFPPTIFASTLYLAR